jgi:hypothetical protein
MASVFREEHLSTLLGRAHRHTHRLSGGGCFVEQRCVAYRQGGEVGHHGLPDQQRLEATLGDLRLVGGVLGVPTRVFEDVALHHRRGDGAGVSHAEQRPHPLVALCRRRKSREGLGFAGLAVAWQTSERKVAAEADPRRHGLADEFVEGLEPEGREHRLDLFVARTDVAAHESVEGREGIRHGAVLVVGGAGMGPEA